MANGNKETVTLKLPSGESVDFVVPGGMSDAEVKTFVLSKRPDLFQSQPPGGQPPDAVAQARANSIKALAFTQTPSNDPMHAAQSAIAKPGSRINPRTGLPMQEINPSGNPNTEPAIQALPILGGTAATMAAGPGAGMAVTSLMGGLGATAGSIAKSEISGQRPTAGGVASDAFWQGVAPVIAGKLVVSPVMKFIQALGGKAAAGPLFQAVSEAAGENTVETSGMLQAAQEAQRLKQAGFGQMPMVITRFLARMKAGTPLTFDDARLIEQAAGGKLTQAEVANMRPQMYAKLAQFADQARKATMQAAGQTPQYPRWGGPGTAETFSDALQQYHAGAQAQDKLEFVKETMMELIKGAAKGVPYGAGATAGGGAVYGIYKALTGDKK